MPGPLVVAFVVGVTPGKWARVWAERWPGHPLDLRPLSQTDALSALRSADADAALVRLPVDDGSLSVIPLYVEQMVVVAPREHPIADFDSLMTSDLSSEAMLTQDWAEAVELVAANVGLALMPQSVARALSRKDVVARPVADASHTQIALVWPAARTTPAVEEFIGIVRGRTANSSRGAQTPPSPRTPAPERKAPRGGLRKGSRRRFT